MSFIDDIKAQAKSDKKRIVLPEYMDSRTYEAAVKIAEEGQPMAELPVPEGLYKCSNGGLTDWCIAGSSSISQGGTVAEADDSNTLEDSSKEQTQTEIDTSTVDTDNIF